MRQNTLTLVVAAGVAIVLLLNMLVYTVEDSRVAVVLTFGKPTSEQAEPGPGLKFPWPIQEVKPFDSRLRVLKAPLEQLNTSDDQVLLVSSFVLWRVKSAKLFLDKVGDEHVARRDLEEFLRNHQAAAISSAEFGHLVSADPKKLRYEQVERRMLEGVRADAEKLGIEVAMVGIRRLGLPREATEAVFDRMKKDRQALATRILEKGRAEADRIRNGAERNRADALAQAEIQAREILAGAEEKARPYYQQMAEDPELAVFLKKLEALKEILDAKSTLVFDTTDVPFDLLDADSSSIAPVGS